MYSNLFFRVHLGLAQYVSARIFPHHSQYRFSVPSFEIDTSLAVFIPLPVPALPAPSPMPRSAPKHPSAAPSSSSAPSPAGAPATAHSPTPLPRLPPHRAPAASCRIPWRLSDTSCGLYRSPLSQYAPPSPVPQARPLPCSCSPPTTSPTASPRSAPSSPDKHATPTPRTRNAPRTSDCGRAAPSAPSAQTVPPSRFLLSTGSISTPCWLKIWARKWLSF